MPRLNRKDTLKTIQTLIEEQEQAELGKTETGEKISDYTTRPLRKLIVELELEVKPKKKTT